MCALLVACAAGSGQAVSLKPGDILVADEGADAVLLVDPLTGDRTIVSSPTVGAGPLFGGLDGIAVHRNGTIFVGAPGQDAVIAIDPLTGDRTIVSSDLVGAGPQMQSPSAIAIRSDGNLLVSDTSNAINGIFRVQPSTGNRALLTDESSVGTGPPLSTPVDIVLEASGDVLTANLGIDAVIRVSALTGDRTIVSDDLTGSGPTFHNVNGIALEADGTILVITGNDQELFRVDPLTGDRTIFSGLLVGVGPGFANIRDVDVALDGTVLAVGPGIDALFTVDPLTGDRAILSGSGFGAGPAFVDPLFLAVVPVPEPSTALLVSLGFLALAARRRSA